MSAPSPWPAPQLEFVFEVRCDVAPSRHVGRGADEQLEFTPVTGGTVAGPRFRGRVLPGGGDWSVARGGVAQLEARYLIEADGGGVVDVLNRGYYRVSPDVQRRLAAGADVTESEVYFRTAPIFQTDHPELRWLTESVFLGMARDEDDQICIRFFLLH